MVCLKRCRADEAVGAVSAGSIVVHFDVLEYRLSHLLPGGESLAVNGLYLERVEEALGAGSSSPAEPPRQALTEPYVSLSTHTALVIQP